MERHPVGEILENSLENLRKLVDVNTVIGTPMTPVEGTTIVPISKVSFGFASGGGGGDDTKEKKPSSPFGVGSGGGVTITPVAFIVITGGKVEMMQISTADNTADRVVNMIPGVVDKLTELITEATSKHKSAKAPAASAPPLQV